MTIGNEQAGARFEPRRGSLHPSFFRRTPSISDEWYDADLLKRARDYARPLKRARRVMAVLSLVIAFAVVLAHLGPAVVGRLPGAPWPLQLLAVLAVVNVIDTVVGLPVSYWVNLRHEKRWGFSNQTLGLWITDQLKGFVLGIIIGWILLSILFAVIRLTSWWWLVAGLLVGVVAIVASFVFPVLILPLFNKQRPVEGELKARIQRLGELAGVPIKRAFLMDASKRSTRDNAFVGGLGSTKRVVVFDTLLEHPGHVLDNVLCHELGHYRLRHILVQVPFAMATSIVMFGLVALVASVPAVLRVAGVSGLGDPAALPLLTLLITLASPATGLVSAWFSRALERQADLEALELLSDPGGFIDVWRRLTTKNLGDLEPSWWARANHSHPENAERMAFIKSWAELNSVAILEPVGDAPLAAAVSPPDPAAADPAADLTG